jgi:uncharacterized membrane protein
MESMTKRAPRSPRVLAPPAPPRAWEVVGLAAAGGAIAAYLGVTKLVNATPLLCGAGGACDVVQGSRYAVLLGVPTALWGVGLYALVGLLAAWPLAPWRWLWSFVLAVAGVAFSAYLTGVSLHVLGAACGWCLASTAFMLAVFVALVRRRPVAGARRVWLRPIRLTVLGSLVALATVGLSFALFSAAATSANHEALARYLAVTGARFYGAYWCPACREQKALFGDAADELPYVECDPRGVGARPDQCAQAGVRAYPTWVIDGRRHEGVASPETLARLSGFTPPAASPPGRDPTVIP